MFRLNLRSARLIPVASCSVKPTVWRQLRFLTTSKKTSSIASTPVFSDEELEAARLARKAALEPYISKLPEKWIPYAELMRLEKPIGTWYLFSPSTWGIVMAAYSVSAPLSSTLYTIALFGAGSLIMRGAGCTINDILDRNLDNKVGRTVERPVASGRVSVPQAVTFLGVLCFSGLAVLLQLPSACLLLGAASIPFIFTYPLFKRFTNYPQAWLSICYGWGILVGFPAMGAWNLAVMIPLYLSNFFWIMTYDTIYAHQDKTFDVKAGIHSTALAWGENSKKIFYGNTVAQMALFATAGVMNGMGPGFALAGLWGGYRIVDMIRKVDLDDVSSCFYHFKNNINTGHVFFGGMVVDYILRLLGFL